MVSLANGDYTVSGQLQATAATSPFGTNIGGATSTAVLRVGRGPAALVPEPAAVGLLALGLITFAGVSIGRRRLQG